MGNLSGRKLSHDLQSLRTGSKNIRNKLDYIKEISAIGKYFEEPVKYFLLVWEDDSGFAPERGIDFDILLNGRGVHLLVIKTLGN